MEREQERVLLWNRAGLRRTLANILRVPESAFHNLQLREREPTLRVACGLFWLWLVLSALWVAGMAFMVGQSFGTIDRIETRATSSWNPSDPSATRCSDDAFDKSAEMLMMGCLYPHSPEEYLAAKAAAQRKAAEDRRSLFWRANFLAFLPPAFLLAVGSALLWAFGGFRL